MLTDEQLLALNILQEAGAEITDGQAAIARIVKNRMMRKYSSDGTVAGTILAKDQFSWAYFGFEAMHTGTDTHDHAHQEYVRLCWTPAEAANHALDLYDMTPPSDLKECALIAKKVMEGVYSGPFYNMLTNDAVLYLNPRILTKQPNWAIPTTFVCAIGRHNFYRAHPVKPAMV